MRHCTLAIGTTFILLAGCTATHPYIRQGDANSVAISYSGDIASTLPLARQHCAQFARVPELAQKGIDVADYDCVKP
jgi:hypothetical protein